MESYDINNWPSAEEIEFKIAEEGAKYTARFWKVLQCHFNKKALTPEQADLYYIVQKVHFNLTGYSLPATIKGARKIKASVRECSDTKIPDEKLDKAVQGGLMAKLKRMREKNRVSNQRTILIKRSKNV